MLSESHRNILIYSEIKHFMYDKSKEQLEERFGILTSILPNAELYLKVKGDNIYTHVRLSISFSSDPDKVAWSISRYSITADALINSKSGKLREFKVKRPFGFFIDPEITETSLKAMCIYVVEGLPSPSRGLTYNSRFSRASELSILDRIQ